MKQLLLVVFFTLQSIISPVILAWSPLDSVEYVTQSRQLCYSVVAANEEDQDNTEKGEDEEEEEPDCD